MLEQIISIEDLIYNGHWLSDWDHYEIEWLVDNSAIDNHLVFDFLMILLDKHSLDSKHI